MKNYIPETSHWWIKAINNETQETKTRIVKVTGPFPLSPELDYYCPPDVCTIIEMTFSHHGEMTNKTQDELYNQMIEELKNK